MHSFPFPPCLFGHILSYMVYYNHMTFITFAGLPVVHNRDYRRIKPCLLEFVLPTCTA
jgi:hypothetical protein